MTKSLEQLRAQAQLALIHPELVKIAVEFSPTAAYERAITLRFSEVEAKSCRFLSVIRRDHGLEAMRESMHLGEEVKLDQDLRDEIASGIGLLEKIGGGKLLIETDKRPRSFVEYLEKVKPSFLKARLVLGDYRIHLSVEPCRTLSGWVRVRHKVIGPDGGPLKFKSHGGDELKSEEDFSSGKSTDEPNVLRRQLHDYIKGLLLSTSTWPHHSAARLIMDDLRVRGHKVATGLYEYCKERNCEIWKLVRYGRVAEIKKLAADLRQKSIKEGILEGALAFLDLEIRDTVKEAEGNTKLLDPTIPLLDKIRRDKGWVGYQVIPGPVNPKTYNFLLNTDGFPDSWIDSLAQKGYGGSALIFFFNVDSGMRVAETGQCHAFLLQQHGWSPKDHILDEAQTAMKEAQLALGNRNVPKLPKFKWDMNNDLLESGFGKFMDKHFPLK